MNDKTVNIRLGEFRYAKKRDITNKFELPQWWRLPPQVRWSHTARNYKKSYDEWTAEFTFDTRKYTGSWLVDYVNKRKPNGLCLDVGCGSNPYKPHIKNVIGMEPGDWGNGDVQWNIMDHLVKYFDDHTFDFIFAIGPFNHGDTYEIEEMLTTLHGLLKIDGQMLCLVKPANWSHLKVDPWAESKGLCYPWMKESIYNFARLCDYEFVMEPVLDGTDLGTLTDEKLQKLASIEPWEHTLNGAPPVESDVLDGDMHSQWQAVQRELKRRNENKELSQASETIRQRWFWIWRKA